VLALDADALDALLDAFADCPPLRRMVAAFLGIKPKERPSKNFADLLSLFPGGVIR
jgi:hypothetical protein